MECECLFRQKTRLTWYPLFVELSVVSHSLSSVDAVCLIDWRGGKLNKKWDSLNSLML